MDVNPTQSNASCRTPQHSAEEQRNSRVDPAADRKPWKPISHTITFLVSYVAASIGLFILLMVLLAKSQQHGGIIFAPNISSDVSVGQSFSYNYLPTILAVIYSICWSWVDADSKRLEVYYQLTRQNGAEAEDSLQLQYAFEFLAWVPLKAFRKKHWPVFAGSLAMVLIFWGVTPVQTGIFATQSLQKVEPVPTEVSNGYLPIADQQSSFSANFTYAVYGTLWLNASLPSYTTRESILSPFRMQRFSSQPADVGVLVAKTRMFSVDLDCQTARLFTNGSQNLKHYYTNDAGCTVPQYGPQKGDASSTPSADPFSTSGSSGQGKEFSSLFAGYEGQPTDFHLSSYCPKNFSNIFFISYGSADNYRDPTALFCHPQYFSQAATANVSLPTYSVNSIEVVGEKQPLAAEMFDAYGFGMAIVTSGATTKGRSDIPQNAFASPYSSPEILNSGLNLQVNGVLKLPDIVAYAIGAYPRSLETYLDPAELKNSYEAAWRLLFVRHMVDVLQTNFSNATEIQGSHVYQTEAVYLVPSFTIIVGILLLLVAFLAAWLLLLTLKRPRNLWSDPASLSSIMSLVADDSNLLNLFKPLDQSTMNGIDDGIEKRKFALSTVQRIEGLRLIGICEPPGNDEREASSSLQGRKGPLSRNFEFHSLTVFGLFLLFAGPLAGGVVLYTKGIQMNGLRLPSQNRFVRQLVESYIPTIVATIIEPCWVLINRLLCMLQPWEELRKNRPRGSHSISLNYFNVPPQLVFAKAFRVGHILLSVVCFMALLANVLSVALSGLMDEQTLDFDMPCTMTEPLSLPFIPSNRVTSGGLTNLSLTYNPGDDTLQFPREAYYTVMSNLTTGSRLPQWTDSKIYYLPFLPQATLNDSSPRKATTRAFGSRLDCQELPVSDKVGNNRDGSYLSHNINVHLKDGTTAQCGHRVTGGGADQQINGCTERHSAAEWVTHVGAINITDTTAQSVCKSLTTFAWWRGSRPSGSCSSTANTTIQDHLIISCRPVISTSMAEVVVDHEDNVIRAQLIGDLNDEVNEFFPTNGVPLQVLGAWSAVSVPRTPNNTLSSSVGADSLETQSSPWSIGYTENLGLWHNDSYPSDNANWLLSKMNTSFILLDPNQPLPNADDVKGQLSAMHSLLFATTLGRNQDRVLYPTNLTSSTNSTASQLSGALIVPQTRIIISAPAFFVAAAILALYIVTLAVGYFHRPARFLPRMPTTLASTIAYLAASHAVTDFRGTAHMTNAQRDAYVDRLDRRYGFGAFTGTDRRQHVGVEYFDPGSDESEDVVQKGLRGQVHKDLPRWGGWRSWWARVKTRGARQDSFRRAVDGGVDSQREESGMKSVWNRIFRGSKKKTTEQGTPYDISLPLQLVRP